MKGRIFNMVNSIYIIKFFCCVLIIASHIGNIIPNQQQITSMGNGSLGSAFHFFHVIGIFFHRNEQHKKAFVHYPGSGNLHNFQHSLLSVYRRTIPDMVSDCIRLLIIYVRCKKRCIFRVSYACGGKRVIQEQGNSQYETVISGYVYGWSVCALIH